MICKVWTMYDRTVTVDIYQTTKADGADNL